MKRATVATIAALMLTCVLPMARAQEAVSQESAPEVVQHDDQSTQQIAALQARLEELMAQQQDLRKQLDTLRQKQQQSSPSDAESKRKTTKRRGPEPFNMYVVEKGDTLASIAEKFYGRELGNRPENIDRIAQANHLDDSGLLHTGQSLRIPVRWMMTADDMADLTHEQGGVTVVPWQGQEPTEQQERALRGAAAQRAKAEQFRAQAEQQRAQVEQLRATAEQMRAQAEQYKESAKQAQKWAQSEKMKQWQADVEKWQNSDEMKRWKQEVEQWGREMGRRYEQNAEANADAKAPGPMPPMPAMPAMPPMHGMSGTVQVVAPTPHVSAMPQPIPHVNANVPHVSVPVPPIPPVVPKEPGQIVSCGDFVVKAVPAGTTLQVENNVGSIAVEGTQDSDCSITATAEIKGVDQEEAEQIAEKILVEVTPADGYVRVRTQLPDDMSKEQRDRIAINLKIAVPEAVKVQVTQKVGDVRLSSLLGDVKAAVDVGSMKTWNLQGNVAIRTNVGSIDFATSTDLSAKVSAQAQIGSISSDLPLKITGAAVVQSGGAKNALGSHATGTLGDGQNKIDLSANVGSIKVHQQSAPPKHEAF